MTDVACEISDVKDGGNSIIFDYKNFWIIESAQPINLPTQIDTEKEAEISPSIKGEYITNNFQGQTNSFLYFQKGATFISVQNLLSR